MKKPLSIFFAILGLLLVIAINSFYLFFIILGSNGWEFTPVKDTAINIVKILTIAIPLISIIGYIFLLWSLYKAQKTSGQLFTRKSTFITIAYITMLVLVLPGIISFAFISLGVMHTASTEEQREADAITYSEENKIKEVEKINAEIINYYAKYDKAPKICTRLDTFLTKTTLRDPETSCTQELVGVVISTEPFIVDVQDSCASAPKGTSGGYLREIFTAYDTSKGTFSYCMRSGEIVEFKFKNIEK